LILHRPNNIQVPLLYSFTKNSYLRLIILFSIFCLFSCGSSNQSGKSTIHTIAFLDAFEDATIAEAKKGFFTALRDSGYIPEQNLQIIYRNAQGDIPALTQSVDYFISKNVSLIATNTTISTISAVQKTNQIPICMMVSPSPELAGLRNAKGQDPTNLFGVYETLEYIDTAITLIHDVFPLAKRVGTLINQSEPQSVDALERIRKDAAALGLEVISLPANSSAETQLVMERLIDQKIDVFFALPDNTIFSSFETVVSSCDKANVPIITSEAGLVSRGAVAGFGANMYDWGYASGQEAAQFLTTGKLPAIKKLNKRVRMFNTTQAKRFNFLPGPEFKPVN
jgi:putative ABC transport system substrate-binding protein